MRDYKPYGVVVKYTPPGWGRYTRYLSFKTMEAARDWIRNVRFYMGVNEKQEKLTRYAVFVQVPIDDIIGWDDETGELTV